MKTALLYTRVSTDDQNNGYSPRYQLDVLQRYCELNNIKSLQHFHDDHSAKTFNRPQFQKLLLQLKKNKGFAELLLFTKWDRFSRNAGDAYAMLRQLNKLSIEAQAIEQPLDLQVPENKMMLAFYLAAPEVENERRALNVMSGMHRAAKEGRYMGKAPFGYINRKNESRKWIDVVPDRAAMVKEIFEAIASEKYSAQSILTYYQKKGLPIRKNAFWNMIKNPLYCGFVRVPAYGGHPEEWVKGQHEAIITPGLYQQVQQVLFSKKKNQKTKKTVHEDFPLRGYLICPHDGKLLTASASQSRGRKYPYYHCTSQCGVRFPAAQVHAAIQQELAKWQPHPAVMELYKQILYDVFTSNRKNHKAELQQLKQQLAHHTQRITKARDLLLNSSIEADDFKAIKQEAEKEITLIESRIAEHEAQSGNLLPLVDAALQSLQHIAAHYQAANATVKREIIASIFPEKLTFTKNGYRNIRVTEAVQLIFNITNAFEEKRNGTNSEFPNLSREVIPLTPFSNLTASLQKLANLLNTINAA